MTSIQCQLLVGPLKHLLNCELSAECGHLDFFLLANTMSTILGLKIGWRIPVIVRTNDNVELQLD
jgi:hypothetical protein